MPAELSETFAALGDPVNLAIVRLLLAEPRRSSEIADALELSRPDASRHLATLRRAALVDGHSAPEDARARVYALRPERFDDLRAFLEEVEAFWSRQLSAFKAHAEGRTR